MMQRVNSDYSEETRRDLCCGKFIAIVASLVLAGAAAVYVDIVLGKGSQQRPHPSFEPYACSSSLKFPVVKPESKGIAIDDHTFSECPWRIGGFWPNTKQGLSSFRVFKAWNGDWPPAMRLHAWSELKRAVTNHEGKIIVGTQITCDEEADDWDWTNVLDLLNFLGPERVMAVAVGNEMELIGKKGNMVSQECATLIWEGGYFWKKMVQRAKDLETLVGFDKIELTTVFGGYALAGWPFVDVPTAKVSTFLANATSTFGKRWIFAWNVYPYFDPANRPDPGDGRACEAALKQATCFEENCELPRTVAELRKRTTLLTGQGDDRMWLTETGWSWPISSTLPGSNPNMASCEAWSSEEAFRTYYENFLKWDLSIGSDLVGPEHVFYMTIRDSNNFGKQEHFGLIKKCLTTTCKIQGSPSPPTQPTTTRHNSHHRTSTTSSSSSDDHDETTTSSWKQHHTTTSTDYPDHPSAKTTTAHPLTKTTTLADTTTSSKADATTSSKADVTTSSSQNHSSVRDVNDLEVAFV
eukprot:TRINITY_DN27389_c0_g1_i1.p1 TRINITY_DN27389_c0_g1~~TRINITY_DN27389_c0_g1_i1.p1  ORF type:complete len:524 (+),score=70.54 TRINITY_DN27389_c0_g1_i1:68-1639(+)